MSESTKQLKQKLVQKQKQILDTIPQKQIKSTVVQPVKSEDDAAKLKQQILADLKADNKESTLPIYIKMARIKVIHDLHSCHFLLVL